MPGPALSSASWKAPAQNVGLKRAKPMFSRQGDRARPHGAQWVGGSPGSDSQPSRFTRHDRAGTGISQDRVPAKTPLSARNWPPSHTSARLAPITLFPFPPALPRRNSEKPNVKEVEGSQETGENLRVRPGHHHLLTLRSNLVASVCPSVK